MSSLQDHVKALAETIGPRCLTRPGTLDRAARYIEDALFSAGLAVERQVFETSDGLAGNLTATGADDNASGVAALIELAARCAKTSPAGPVRFVAFANEETPYFATPAMGSLRCANEARARGDKIQLMMSLEMLGYYTDERGSQRYLPLYGIGRPKQGNFIGVVGRMGSGKLLRRIAAAFRQGTSLPIETAQAPEWVEGVSLSDHWAFWQTGYPAVMVTDTAFYRNPHYHTKLDTWDTLDYARMAQVVDGLHKVLATFAV